MSQTNGSLSYITTQYPRTGRFLTLFRMTSFLSEANRVLMQQNKREGLVKSAYVLADLQAWERVVQWQSQATAK